MREGYRVIKGTAQGAARTRKEFLKAVGGGALLALSGLAGSGLVGCEPDANIRASASPARTGRTLAFRSRPDLRPPPVEVTTPAARGASHGYLFAAAKNGPDEAYPAQDGPMILDNVGSPVWLRPVREEERDVMDFKAQVYRGRPVLTWWEGVHGGYGRGEYVIFDDSYREVARVRAGNGYEGDHHEFLITARDTALIVIYGPARKDLSSVGGAADGAVLEGVIQEIDIASGEVLFEWHSLEHVDVGESYQRPRPGQRAAFDYFHINSVDVDEDENLIVSARRTSAVYKIHRETGQVIWRLGGKRSDFEMGEGARFAFQHDARRHPDGTITLFDNRGEDMGEPSRAVALKLDEGAMNATLAKEYVHPDRFFAIFQGNIQALPGGNVFVGWGSAPYLSEFSREGMLLFDARFPDEAESYRAFRLPWKGLPKDRPTVAAESENEDRTTLYVSWNGATEVAAWEVLAGPNPDRLEPLGSVPRKGFETAVTFTTAEPYVAVGAQDRSGRTLNTSETVRRRSRQR
jgi:hypothetical protein